MIDSSLDSPIFVLAYMHSGTTLLQQIMSRHSAIFVSGGETRHFSNLAITRRKFPDLNDDVTLREYLVYLLRVICTGYATVNFHSAEKDGMIDLAEMGFASTDIDQLFQLFKGQRDYTKLYLLVFDYLARRSGKKRWLDKLPGYVSQFEQIRTASPQAQFIELVRDGRDILASKKKRVARGGGYDPVWDSIAWRSAVNAGSQAGKRFPDQVLRVKYEDLVTAPSKELNKICQFLNLEFDEAMLGVGWINTTTADNESVEGGISTAAVGKFAGQLSKSEIAISQTLTREQLNNAGYEIVPISRSTYLATPALLIKSGFEFFGRLLDRWRQGGFRYLVNVINNYRMRLNR